ncbi:hypothetical protein M408DRAFT_331019, partial [Serendipita vermifera MAFF 305830]
VLWVLAYLSRLLELRLGGDMIGIMDGGYADGAKIGLRGGDYGRAYKAWGINRISSAFKAIDNAVDIERHRWLRFDRPWYRDFKLLYWEISRRFEYKAFFPRNATILMSDEELDDLAQGSYIHSITS